MNRAIRSFTKQIWLLYGLFCACVAGLLYLHYVVDANNHRIVNSKVQCIGRLYEANRQRTLHVLPASLARDEASRRRDAATRAVNDAVHAAIAYAEQPLAEQPEVTKLVSTWNRAILVFQGADNAYQRADAAYQATVRAWPVPPPAFNCSSGLTGQALDGVGSK